MARRIFEIAKELGVDSKAIVAKCQAEGIPAETVKNHMSTVSVGLEVTIREWFSEHVANAGSAVETAEKVDLDKVKVKSTRRRGSKKDGKGEDHHDEAEQHADADTATQHAEQHAEPHTDKPAEKAPEHAEPKVETHDAPKADVTPKPAEAIAAEPEAPATPQRVEVDARHDSRPEVAHRETESPTIVEPKVNGPTSPSAPSLPSLSPRRVSIDMPEAPAADAAPTAPAGPTQLPREPLAPAASAPSAGGHVRPHAPGSDRDGPGRDGPGRDGPGREAGTSGRGPSTPAPMNRPTRPTTVSPVGPKLTQAAPVRLSGPKVVRVEAPEQIEAPRPRRPMGAPSTGGGYAGGPGGANRGPRPGGGATTEGDRGGDSARRRGGPPPAATPASKRSSGAGIPSRRRASSGEEWGGGQIFSEQDIIEREERLARAKGFLKQRKQDLSRSGQIAAPGPSDGRVRIAAPFTLKDLSAATGVKVPEISKRLFMQGLMFKINDPMPTEKAIEVMMDFNVELEVTEHQTAEEAVTSEFANREKIDVRARGPVVTILGHVDHGKTSLLDKIRNTKVAAGEAGGITQKTSAFVAEVTVEGKMKPVVFLDTPGHEAFTSMRSRGAKMTDVVVLVVSAPEGVMPQTIESINHAKAAGVPIVVALNKIDRPDATEQQVQKTLGELAKAGLNPVEWGGETEMLRTSATTGQGIPELLEVLDYQAQLLDLKADFGGGAQGTVIESRMEEGRGAVANLLVQQGKLKVGDFVVMGRAHGRVRDITDDRGRRIREAIPPIPVQISGINTVCDAGDKFYVVESLKQAQEAAEQRVQRERHTALAAPKLTLDSLFSQIQANEGDSKEIRVILKTDQQGTVDVLKTECEKIKTEEVRVRVIDSGVGGITESNVLLGEASKAIVIGFNVVPSGKARQLAEQKGVEIRTYEVIYDITDDLRKAAEGLLAPEVREELLGHAEVRAVFKVTKVGNIAGCYVTDGLVQRDALIRVTRDGVVIESNRKLSQLKRVKDDAREVRAGLECGMKIDAYDDIKVGDIIECYRKTEVKRTL